MRIFINLFLIILMTIAIMIVIKIIFPVVTGLFFGTEFWYELENNFWNGNGLDQWFIIGKRINEK